jgi:sulfite oxidase
MSRLVSRRCFLENSAAATAALSLAHWTWGRETAAPQHSDLIVRSAAPRNAEPPLGLLAAADVTPVERFYVRNHGPVPEIAAADFRLRIEGLVHKPLTLSLKDLQGKFPKQSAEATLICAGNRRQEMSATKPIAGVQWDAGAIGNASWKGASLADLLAAAEIQPDAKHVWFEGHDPITEKDGSVAPFGGSIPLDRAQVAGGKTPGALVAYEMNDKPLTPEHGFPLRTVVPGYIGARSVKWLAKIVVSDRPSPNHYVAEAYKIVTSDAKDVLAAAEPIYEFPINAAICLPAAGAKLRAGKTRIAGYALAPGAADVSIAKVEISTDGGRNWRAAELAGKPRPFCWQLWHAEFDLPAGKHEIVARATDSQGRVQPESCDWNLKGYLYNAWHHVSVVVA